MSKCVRCNLIIKDDTESCPFCHQVLEADELVQEDKYPDARVVTRKFRLFENIVLFVSIVAAMVCLTTDYMISGMTEWSIVVVLALIYGNVVLRLSILGKSGYMFKTIWSLLSALVIFGLIDYITGYKRWSANYVYPVGIIGMNIAVLILMITNRRNWQSYMMTQLFLIVLSLVALVLIWAGVITFPYLALIAAGCSLFLFLGTLIIGDQRARTELKRRFYI